MLEQEKDGSRDISGFGRQITRIGWTALGLLILFCCCAHAFAKNETPKPDASISEGRGTAPSGMVWIPGTEFIMGTDDVRSFPNERPAHKVQVDGFWMDEHDVTSAEFAKFVEETGYVTTAERQPDWEELKKELPPGTPKPEVEWAIHEPLARKADLPRDIVEALQRDHLPTFTDAAEEAIYDHCEQLHRTHTADRRFSGSRVSLAARPPSRSPDPAAITR